MWYFRALHEHAATFIRTHHSHAAGNLLDAGCGTGGFIRRATPGFPNLRFIGIDLFQIACELAQQRGTPRITRASSTELPFDTSTMAVVTSLDVLQHIPDQERAVAEIYRVLEPGGLAVINAPAYEWLWSYHDDSTDTERRYTRTRMLTLLRKAGFDVVQSTYWNLLPLPLVTAKRKLLGGLGGTDDVKLYPKWADACLELEARSSAPGLPPLADACRQLRSLCCEEAGVTPHDTRLFEEHREAYEGKRVVVTGGLGFIGSSIAKALASLGADVTVVDALIPETGGNLRNLEGIGTGKVRVNMTDVRNRNTLPYLIRGKDVLFNLAGQTSHMDSMTDPENDLEINARAQLSILETAGCTLTSRLSSQARDRSTDARCTSRWTNAIHSSRST